jgi:hypothetical protein
VGEKKKCIILIKTAVADGISYGFASSVLLILVLRAILEWKLTKKKSTNAAVGEFFFENITI